MYLEAPDGRDVEPQGAAKETCASREKPPLSAYGAGAQNGRPLKRPKHHRPNVLRGDLSEHAGTDRRARSVPGVLQSHINRTVASAATDRSRGSTRK